MKARIVILGDSLSLPRPDEGVFYEDIYSHLLHKHRYEVLNKSRRANDTNKQLMEQNILDDIIYVKPSIVIIYLGIVDCAPRLFTKKEARALSLFPPILRNFIVKLFSKYRKHITKFRRINYVSKDEFQRNLSRLIKIIKQEDAKIIIINISNTNHYNEKRSHNFKKNINDYNLILCNIAKDQRVFLIKTNHMDNILLNDGIHINKKAHEIISQEILRHIENYQVPVTHD